MSSDFGEVLRSCGKNTVQMVLPLLDDARLAQALEIPDLEQRMLAVAELVQQVVPLPDDGIARAAMISSIRLGVLMHIATDADLEGAC